MRKYLGFGLATVLALVGGCTGPQGLSSPSTATLQLKKLGKHSFPVTTKAPAAQRAFDHGLSWAYSFAYHAAEQEFKRAVEADPRCAMAYWGIALVNGPHINYPLVPPDRAAKAWAALVRAQDLATECTAREKGLIRALGSRYAAQQPDDRAPLDAAYAAAMQALWHFTRASAFTALNRLAEARAERDVFASQAARLPAGAFLGNNNAADILAVASRVLEGEMLAQEGNLTQAVAVLEEAVQREDKLRYDEPPDWIQPVRHTLGAVLLRANRAAEAEAVYRADLRTWPDNGWSLIGLQAALTTQGRHPEAQAVNARWRKAWADADVAPDSSCYCQAGRFALNRP